MFKNGGGRASIESKRTAAIARRNALKLLGAGVGGSIAGAGFGVTGLDRAAALTVIDDFEDGDIDEYAGNTGEYEVEQSTALEGNYRLKCTGSYGRIASSTSSPRGYEYKCRFVAGSGTGGKPGILTCVQDRSRPLEDCYWLVLDIPNQELRVFRRENDASTMLASASVNASEGTEYRGALELGSDTLKGVLYDASGSKITETTAATDTTYSSGYFGFYTGGSPGYPTYYDYVTQASLDSEDGSSGSTLVIDDYDDGSLSEYTTDDSAAFDLVSTPTHSDSYAFRAKAGESGTDYAIAMPSAMPEAPEAGDTFWFYFYPEQATSDIYYVIFGAQGDANTKPGSEQYRVRTDADGKFRFYVHDGSSWTELARDDTVNYSIGAWNKVEVDWGTDGSFTITHYDSAGTQTAQMTATDTLYTSGGFGYTLPAGASTARYYDTWEKSGSGSGSGSSQGSSRIIDDFEDGDLSEYEFENGNGDAAEVVSSPIHHGERALKLSGAHFHLNSTSGLDNYPEAGDAFGGWIRGSSDIDGSLVLLYGVQDFENRYYAYVDINSGTIRIRKKESGSITTLDEATGLDLSTGAWYEIDVRWRTTGRHVFSLYDTNGHLKGQVTATDSTWTSGGIGFNAHTSNGASGYFDYVRLTGNCAPGVIDDFEDGDLSEYEFENGNKSSAKITSTTTYRGDRALALSGEHYHLNSTSGLRNYPRAGDVFSAWIQGSSDIDGSLVLLYGVQDFENRYYAYVDIANGVLRIRKKENGSITTLAEQTGLGLSTQTWYEVEVDWGTDGTHTVSLYDTGGSQLGQVSISNETTWTNGGIGYNAHTSNGATGYFDHVTVSRTCTLGDFETNLDHCTISGSGGMERVKYENFPGGVREGDRGLLIRPESADAPVLTNASNVAIGDLAENPYLYGDVLPAFENSDSDIKFELRYYRSDTDGIEALKECKVPPNQQRLLHWDMSNLGSEALQNPEKLEICWYPSDHPPSTGSFDYDGLAVFDGVFLTSNPAEIGERASVDKIKNLRLERGKITQFNVQTMSQDAESGDIYFNDGTSVPYSFDILGDGQYEYTIDGEAFKLGGGW